MNSKFKTPGESPGFVLWRLTTSWQKQLRQTLAPLQLTHVEFVVMACLQWLSLNSPDAITQAMIVKMADLDKMVVSQTCKSLLEKKRIKRVEHKTDGRAFALELTSSGNKLIKKAMPLVEAVDREFFAEKKEVFLSLGAHG